MREEESSNDVWQAWEPERLLRTFSANEIRFSKGFLAADLVQMFARAKAHWLPLFHSLGTSIQLLSVEKSFHFPQSLKRLYVVEVDNEKSLLGLDSRAERSLAQAVAPKSEGRAAEMVIDYLERRLLASLSKSWSGSESFNCFHLNDSEPRSVAVAASVHLQLSVEGVGCDIWFGLGARLVDRIDQAAKEGGYSISASLPVGENFECTVDIAELLVPPELLVDYLRAETVIGLDLPVRSDVIVRLNDRPWALGRLGQYKGNFAVEIVDFDPGVIEDTGGNTKLRVEVARFSLDSSTLRDMAHRGAVIATPQSLNSSAALVISGEVVGQAVVGEISGQFALNVLGKS